MANSIDVKGILIHVGDTVDVHYRLIEKEKVSGKAKKEVKEETRERIQLFTGIVISVRGEGDNKSFTVRRIGAQNIGIERIFPAISPWIAKVTIKKRGSVRRAKLFYLRDKVGSKADKLKEKFITKEQMEKEKKEAAVRAEKGAVSSKEETVVTSAEASETK